MHSWSETVYLPPALQLGVAYAGVSYPIVQSGWFPRPELHFAVHRRYSAMPKLLRLDIDEGYALRDHAPAAPELGKRNIDILAGPATSAHAKAFL